MLDLFLAQPFGGRSLLQRCVRDQIIRNAFYVEYVLRMFTSTLNEEVKSLEMDIEAVKEKVEDPVICEKVRQYVYASREFQEYYKAEAGRSYVIGTHFCKRAHLSR